MIGSMDDSSFMIEIIAIFTKVKISCRNTAAISINNYKMRNKEGRGGETTRQRPHHQRSTAAEQEHAPRDRCNEIIGPRSVKGSCAFPSTRAKIRSI